MVQAFLSELEYKVIHEKMPIACVDIVVRHDEGILLIKRDIEPLKGEWFFPGGRIYKGEPIIRAASRIVKNEAGLDLLNVERMGIEETFFRKDPFGHGGMTHTINIVMMGVVFDPKVKIDKHHTDYRWVPLDVDDIMKFHPYVYKYILLAREEFVQ